jgi:two-component system phosphate regulon sensor histidine kinase PhoR
MTIFRKNIITLGIVVCGFSAILTVAALAVIEYQYGRVKNMALLDAARSLIAAVGEDSVGEYFSDEGRSMDGALMDSLNAVRDKGDYRLSLIAVNGDVLWDSAGDGRWVNHIDRDEVRTALEGEEGIARRDSLSTGVRQMYAALPVFISGNTADGIDAANTVGAVAGVFRLSIEDSARPPATIPFLLCSILLTFAAFAAITVFSHFLAVPLRRLADIAETTAGKRPYQDISSIVDVSGEAEELFVLETALWRITDKLSREAAQTEIEGRKLLAILNGMSEAVFAMDDNLVLYLVNPRACSLFGHDSGLPGASLLEATRSTELEQAARKVLAEGRSLEMEIKIRTGNGEVRTEQWFQVFAAPLSAPAGVVMVMENITRLVKLEQMRKDFVANVSHELRTPIQLIKGFSETLLDMPTDNKEQSRRCIEIIHKNVRTMENLTNDLLALANLEDNADISPLEKQQLAPLFAEAVLLIEPQAKIKKTEIAVNCPADFSATVHGPFIIQALVNLLDNGIKYSPKKSQVWASVYRENGKVVLEVRDKGMGIPSEHLGRIFERFYRVDKSHSRETGGTGLGLSIVRHIALLHNGTVEVESRAGEGSVFRLRIPG